MHESHADHYDDQQQDNDDRKDRQHPRDHHRQHIPFFNDVFRGDIAHIAIAALRIDLFFLFKLPFFGTLVLVSEKEHQSSSLIKGWWQATK